MSQDEKNMSVNEEVITPDHDGSSDERDNEEVITIPEEEVVDYKKAWEEERALKEEERARREKAEKKAIKLKRKMRESRDDGDDDEDEDPDDSPSVDELVSREVRKRTLISQYTTDPDQQKMIEDNLSLIVSSGDIAADIRRAALLANEKFYMKLQKEQGAKQMSEMGASTSANTGGEPMTQPPKTQTEEDKLAEKFTKGLPPRYQKIYKKS